MCFSLNACTLVSKARNRGEKSDLIQQAYLECTSSMLLRWGQFSKQTGTYPQGLVGKKFCRRYPYELLDCKSKACLFLHSKKRYIQEHCASWTFQRIGLSQSASAKNHVGRNFQMMRYSSTWLGGLLLFPLSLASFYWPYLAWNWGPFQVQCASFRADGS